MQLVAAKWAFQTYECAVFLGKTNIVTFPPNRAYATRVFYQFLFFIHCLNKNLKFMLVKVGGLTELKFTDAFIKENELVIINPIKGSDCSYNFWRPEVYVQTSYASNFLVGVCTYCAMTRCKYPTIHYKHLLLEFLARDDWVSLGHDYYVSNVRQYKRREYPLRGGVFPRNMETEYCVIAIDIPHNLIWFLLEGAHFLQHCDKPSKNRFACDIGFDIQNYLNVLGRNICIKSPSTLKSYVLRSMLKYDLSGRLPIDHPSLVDFRKLLPFLSYLRTKQQEYYGTANI